MKKVFSGVTLAALALASPLALSHQAGDVIVRAGAVKVDPRERSARVSINGVKQPGTSATLNSNTQPGLNMTYMFTDYLGIDALATTPVKHKIGIKDNGDSFTLGTTKHLPPTLSLVYYPMGNRTDMVQPYLGAGVNYTWFFDSRLKGENKANFHGLDVKNSLGWALQTGIDFDLGDNFLFNAQIRYIDLQTTGKTKTVTGQKVKVDIDVDPLVYMLGVGYKF